MSYLFWFILAMLKFQVCLLSATIAGSWLFILITLLGGLFGVVIFTQIGYDIEKWLIIKFPKRFKRFSFKNRLLVRLRKHGGIIGISFLAPILLGIPLGVALCLTLTTDKISVIKPMIISLLLWSLAFLTLVLVV